MKVRTLISGIIMLAAMQMQSQTLVGLPKDEVKIVIKEKYKGMTPDNSVVKQHFNYLKFINRSQTVTLIVYFSDNDVSTSSKMVCDYTEYDFVLDDLNEKYESTGRNIWQYKIKDTIYQIILKEEEWYFTVRESKAKEKKSRFKKQ